jgi:hypothetical protein
MNKKRSNPRPWVVAELCNPYIRKKTGKHPSALSPAAGRYILGKS